MAWGLRRHSIPIERARVSDLTSAGRWVMAETKFKRRAPIGTYWNNLSDAQATILAQFIFLLGAAWATVLLPLLFAGRLRSHRGCRGVRTARI